jgi:hypothetical protein
MNKERNTMQGIDSIASSRQDRLRQHLHRMALLLPGILMLIISDNDEISTITVFCSTMDKTGACRNTR